MNYLISRHAGAINWLEARGFENPILLNHATQNFIDSLTESDMVFGTLPIHLAEAVCHQGARFFNLTLDVPAEYRGKELTCELMEEFDARLTEYRIYECGRRTRLADMVGEFKFIAMTLAKAGETLRSMKAIIHSAYMKAHPEKYS